MKFKPFIATAGMTVTLGLCLTITSADAQGRRGNRNPNPLFPQVSYGDGGTNQPNTLPMQIQILGTNNNIVDPAVSAKLALVYRIDVQDALGLDLKQKNALDALKTVQAQDQLKLGQEARTLLQTTRRPGAQNPTTDPQQSAQDVTAKVQGMAQGYQTDLAKRADEILTPKQRKRLNELDLQWRGPLALVDPKVAEQAAVLSADDKKKVDATYKEFVDARQNLMKAMMTSTRARTGNPLKLGGTGITDTASTAGGTSAASNAPSQPMSAAEREAAQRQARTEFNKDCAAMVAKLLANVTPQSAAAWKEMTGAPFTFRAELNQN